MFQKNHMAIRYRFGDEATTLFGFGSTRTPQQGLQVDWLTFFRLPIVFFGSPIFLTQSDFNSIFSESLRRLGPPPLGTRSGHFAKVPLSSHQRAFAIANCQPLVAMSCKWWSNFFFFPYLLHQWLKFKLSFGWFSH